MALAAAEEKKKPLATELDVAKELAVAAVEKAVILAKAVAKGEAKAKLVVLQEGNESLKTQGLATLKEELERNFEQKKEQERIAFEAKEKRLEDEVSTKKKKVETLREDLQEEETRRAESGDKEYDNEKLEKCKKDLKDMEFALAGTSAKLEMVLDERKEAS